MEVVETPNEASKTVVGCFNSSSTRSDLRHVISGKGSVFPGVFYSLFLSRVRRATVVRSSQIVVRSLKHSKTNRTHRSGGVSLIMALVGSELRSEPIVVRGWVTGWARFPSVWCLDSVIGSVYYFQQP